MRKALMATLVLGVGAGSASAQLELRGSDTLFTFTTNLITSCGINPATEMVYRGGGSSLGEGQNEVGNQSIAPMSRFIDTGSCNGSGARLCDSTIVPIQGGGQTGDDIDNDADGTVDEPGELCGGGRVCATDGRDNNGNGTVDEAGELCRVGQGCKVALDALSVFGDDAEANSCDTLRHSGSITVENLNGIAGLDDGAGTVVGNSFTFSDWRDALRIIYGGQHVSATADACSELPPGRSLIANQRCNSDVRHSLAANWNNVFEEGAGCIGGDTDACATLKHAFRRDDVSGTTDTFLELLALPAIVDRPFCNGREQEDEDPIRRNCDEAGSTDGDEQVCNTVATRHFTAAAKNTPALNPGWFGGVNGNAICATDGIDNNNNGTIDEPNEACDNNSADLGLVLPMVIPNVNAYSNTGTFQFCSLLPAGGTFRLRPMPVGAVTPAQQRCPDGRARSGGQCAWPARADAATAGGFRFDCINRKGNVPGARSTQNMDGRVYNLVPREQVGAIKTVPRVNTAVTPPVSVDIEVHHAFYRIHESRTLVGGTPAAGCKLVDATEQIGCLVSASPCSIGFAGLAADKIASNKPLAMRTPLAGGGAVLPTAENVRRLNDQSGAGCGAAGDFDIRFPLSRALWMNSTRGFEVPGSAAFNFSNIGDTGTGREFDLVNCACDRFYSDRSAWVAGFFSITGCDDDGIDNDTDGTIDEGEVPGVKAPEPCCPTAGLTGVCQDAANIRSCEPL